MKKLFLLVFISTLFIGCSSEDSDENESSDDFYTFTFQGQTFTETEIFYSSIETDDCDDGNKRIQITLTSEIETSDYFIDFEISSPYLTSDYPNSSSSINAELSNMESIAFEDCINGIWVVNPYFEVLGDDFEIDPSNSSTNISSVSQQSVQGNFTNHKVVGSFNLTLENSQSETIQVSGEFNLTVESIN